MNRTRRGKLTAALAVAAGILLALTGGGAATASTPTFGPDDSYAALTSDVSIDVSSGDGADVAFTYDLRPGASSSVLEVYALDAAGVRYYGGLQFIPITGPAAYEGAFVLEPGTYTLYVTGAGPCGDCMNQVNLTEPISFAIVDPVDPEPTPEPSETATPTPTPTPTPSPTPIALPSSGDPADDNDADAELPPTGANLATVLPTAAIGGGVLAIGAAVMLVLRRRATRHTEHAG